MTVDKLNNNEKTEELVKYRDLVLAAIDYFIDHIPKIKTADFDSDEHFKGLKIETIESFKKGRLSKLKQWFRDLTEMQIETRDFKFNKYIKDKTSYDIDIFDAYFKRIEKVIDKGKITTDNQFYDINMMVDYLCQSTPVDNQKIELLNRLIADYEARKSRKR
jgi:hypothetical protein